MAKSEQSPDSAEIVRYNKCPLGEGLYWENEGQIPDICEVNCGILMTSDGTVPENREYDVFPEYSTWLECSHSYGLITADCSLQRGVGPERVFSVTDECEECSMEYGAQSYKFSCPLN